MFDCGNGSAGPCGCAACSASVGGKESEEERSKNACLIVVMEVLSRAAVLLTLIAQGKKKASS